MCKTLYEVVQSSVRLLRNEPEMEEPEIQESSQIALWERARKLLKFNTDRPFDT